MERTPMMTKATLALSAALLFASGSAAVAQFYAPDTDWGARSRQGGSVTISDERYRSYHGTAAPASPSAGRSRRAGHRPGDTNGF
jgi:hypothetical protein